MFGDLKLPYLFDYETIRLQDGSHLHLISAQF